MGLEYEDVENTILSLIGEIDQTEESIRKGVLEPSRTFGDFKEELYRANETELIEMESLSHSDSDLDSEDEDEDEDEDEETKELFGTV